MVETSPVPTAQGKLTMGRERDDHAKRPAADRREGKTDWIHTRILEKFYFTVVRRGWL